MRYELLLDGNIFELASALAAFFVTHEGGTPRERLSNTVTSSDNRVLALLRGVQCLRNRNAKGPTS